MYNSFQDSETSSKCGHADETTSTESEDILPTIAKYVGDNDELTKICTSLRRKEQRLKGKSSELEQRLVRSESNCSRLMDENTELKTEVDALENEITEVWMSICCNTGLLIKL